MSNKTMKRQACDQMCSNRFREPIKASKSSVIQLMRMVLWQRGLVGR